MSDSPVGSPVFKVGVLAHRERRQPPVEVTVAFRDTLAHELSTALTRQQLLRDA